MNGTHVAIAGVRAVSINGKREAQIHGVKEFVETILTEMLDREDKYTGTVVFTVNCRCGGVGNTEAFAQQKIS
jgi:hypothetical protein